VAAERWLFQLLFLVRVVLPERVFQHGVVQAVARLLQEKGLVLVVLQQAEEAALAVDAFSFVPKQYSRQKATRQQALILISYRNV
jgi:hypothetical protein